MIHWKKNHDHQCINIIFAQKKKTRWRYFKKCTANPPDFLKRSSFVILITVELKSAAYPPAGPLLLLLPGLGARQGWAACLHGWEALLEASDVSSGCFSKLAQPSVSVLKSQLQFIFSNSWTLWNLCWIGLTGWTWSKLARCWPHLDVFNLYTSPRPFFVCLGYANLYANTAGQRSPI